MKHPALAQGGLYAVTDPLLLPGEQLLEGVEAALAGGATMLQYRDKTASASERRQRAQALLDLCARYAVPLIINDDVELAAEIGAAGVHLGQSDVSPEVARDLLGELAIIGLSGYADLGALTCPTADYVAFGRFFASPTKPQARHAPLEILTQARARSDKPLIAIGGIHARNARRLRAAGADWIAVVSGLFGSEDIEATARQLCSAIAQPI